MGFLAVLASGLALVGALRAGYGWLRRAAAEPHVRAAAERHGVDPGLVRAVIWRESRFRPRSRGAAGERGLMQVTKAAAWEWAAAEGVADFRFEMMDDPGLNVQAGAWYLARGLDYWADRDDPAAFALAEYNAGRTRVLRWAEGAESAADLIEAITYPGTRRYVRQVLRRWRGRAALARPPG